MQNLNGGRSIVYRTKTISQDYQFSDLLGRVLKVRGKFQIRNSNFNSCILTFLFLDIERQFLNQTFSGPSSGSVSIRAAVVRSLDPRAAILNGSPLRTSDSSGGSFTGFIWI